MSSPQMPANFVELIQSSTELIYGARLGQIGAVRIVQMLQLFAQQDPCPRQVHKHGLFFRAFRSLRHAQALDCVTLEVNEIAHLPHSTEPYPNRDSDAPLVVGRIY